MLVSNKDMIEILLLVLIWYLVILLIISYKFFSKNKEYPKNKISITKVDGSDPLGDLEHLHINFIQKSSNYILKFPKKLRLELSNYIFNHLFKNRILDEKIILEIILLKFEIGDDFFQDSSFPNDFKEIREKLLNKKLRIGIINYLYDLIGVISKLFHYKKDEVFLVREFVSILYSESITLGMTQLSLENVIAEIFDFLKLNNTNFKLNRLKIKSLFDDGEYKECSKCGEIKKYKEFDKIENRLRYICRKCALINKSINLFKKKIKIFNILFGEQGLIKCCECNTSIENLPALELHHVNPTEKTASWRDIQNQDFKRILETLKKEDVIILCSNCHSKRQAKYYVNYDTLILNNFFLETSEDVIDNIIYNFLKRKNSVYNVTMKRQIVKWIKKRIIVEKFFNGKCVGCKVDFVNYNLPALQFHHTLSEEKDELVSWQKISHLPIGKISYLIDKEECICLCGNCHRLIHAPNFMNNLQNILVDDMDKIISNVERKYEELLENVSNFKFKPLVNLFMFNSENWLTKSQLRILWSLKNNQLSINQICKTLGYKRTFCYSKLKVLEIREYIFKKINPKNREFKYFLTEEGSDLLNHYKTYKKSFSELFYFDFDD